MLTFEQASEAVLAQVSTGSSVLLPLHSALGYVLSEDIPTKVDMPAFENSQMDGFAVRSTDRSDILRIVGESRAGYRSAESVVPGTAVRVMTGAPIPAGADTVVPVEDVEIRSPLEIRILVPGKRGQFIRYAAEDCAAGSIVLSHGTFLSSAAIGLAAAAGYATLPVISRPRVAVFSTGDEVAPPDSPLGDAQIFNSNLPALLAQSMEAGADVVHAEHLPDDPDSIAEGLMHAIDKGAEAIVTSGGVSVGEYDFVRKVIEKDGHLNFWRIAIRPGKPLTFGDWNVSIFFGLPGNAVSTWVTFELFVRPALLKMRGLKDVQRPKVVATTVTEITHEPGRRSFMRATTTFTGTQWRAEVIKKQGSHVLSGLVEANSLVVVPEDVEFIPAGGSVQSILLKEPVIAG